MLDDIYFPMDLLYINVLLKGDGGSWILGREAQKVMLQAQHQMTGEEFCLSEKYIPHSLTNATELR